MSGAAEAEAEAEAEAARRRRGMALAVEARTLGTCAPKTGNDMGAVVLGDGDEVLAWGFARSLRRDATRAAIDLHAEADCITQAARRGIALEGKTIFVTSAPCARCLPLILGSGIAQIVHCDPLTRYIGERNEAWARELIAEAGCELVENLERPPYKQIAASTRVLARREAAVEDRIDLTKLLPRKKRCVDPDREASSKACK